MSYSIQSIKSCSSLFYSFSSFCRPILLSKFVLFGRNDYHKVRKLQFNRCLQFLCKFSKIINRQKIIHVEMVQSIVSWDDNKTLLRILAELHIHTALNPLERGRQKESHLSRSSLSHHSTADHEKQ